MTIMTVLRLIPRERWRLLRLELRWAYRGRVQPRYVGHWGYSPQSTAWLVLRGWARIRGGGGVAEARTGDWLVAPPGERLAEASDDCEILSLAFVARWAFGRELFPLARPVAFAGRSVPLLRALGVRLASDVERGFPGARYELPEASGTVAAHLRLEAGFRAWFAALAACLQRMGFRPDVASLDSRVEEAVELIERSEPRSAHPSGVAKDVGLSASQLNRLFRRDLGMTLREYSRRHRLAVARTLLAGSGTSVKEIAFRLGFVSPQHFSRWFRQGTKMTPSRCRVSGGTGV